MLSTRNSARQRAAVLVTIGLVVTPLLASHRAATHSSGQRTVVTATPQDSHNVHNKLRDKIEDFQDAWRREWQRGLTERLGPIDVRDMARNNSMIDPNVRRFWALTCYGATPRMVPIQVPSPVVRRPVVSKPDRGSICPMWSPPRDGEPPDEGEAIDLAIPGESREPLRVMREKLISALEDVQQKYPDDLWIAGQRVRFVYDQRSPERTVSAALACRGQTAGCSALLGWAFEQAGNIPAADSAFRVADSVALAPVTHVHEHCIENDVLVLFNVSDRAKIEEKKCEEQRAVVRRLWWLSDPLWSVAGNERYVAHGSRRISTMLHAVTDVDERYVWADAGAGASMRQLVLRYGWPSFTYWPGWQAENARARSMERIPPLRRQRHVIDPIRPIRVVFTPFTVKEYTVDRTALLPDFKAIVDPFSLNESHWSLRNPDERQPDAWWPQEHMMLGLHMSPLNGGQDAQWRRDSSITYQLAIDDPLRKLDTTATGASLAVLMGGTSADSTYALARAPIAEGLTLRLKANLMPSPLVLSAEVLPRTPMEQTLRLRFGLRPPPSLLQMTESEVALSDPVFLRMPNRSVDVPTDESTVLRYMAGGVSFTRAEPVAVYWESYGFQPGDTVQVEIRLRRDDERNAARRVGAAFGIASALRDSVSIKWTEPDARHSRTTVTGAKPVIGRSVFLDLASLNAGRYVLITEVRKGRSAAAHSERRFVVTDQ